MSSIPHPSAEPDVPRGALIAAAVLVAASILAAATVRLTGYGKSEVPPAAIAASIDINFADRADGAVEVLEGGRVVAEFQSGTNGFLRGVLRNFARERRLNGLGREAPFRLSRRTDGRLMITDTATGRDLQLNGFGDVNVAAFAELLSTEGKSP
jgi:putative photosynthetic complex assembly protein